VFTHTTVLPDQAVEALAIKPDGIYVDGTFGRGGHSRLILSQLGNSGRLVAFDMDPAAVAIGKMIEDRRFCIIHASFSRIKEVLRQSGVNRIDGVLLDLGVSSPQLEEACRGFSFQADGPLDMRMNPGEGVPAAEWLEAVPEAQLEEVIKIYGEERFAKQIARAIVEARARQPLVTTHQLASIVAAAIPARKREKKQNPATRTFQAIRIYLNQELEKLSLALQDWIVKRFMRASANRDDLPRKLPLRLQEVQLLSRPTLRLIGKMIRPDEAEMAANPRARSAVMRVAERIDLS
jgi:16S rRNA (cytosine1402-N4)-methyltransferase